MRRVVDARGRPCPHPVIELARAAASAAEGDELEVLASDPAAEHDVPAWCRMRGHELLGCGRDPDGSLRLAVRIRRGSTRRTPAEAVSPGPS